MQEIKQEQVTAGQGEEISLKDLILKSRKWWRYLTSKWLVILIFALIGGGLGLTYALFDRTEYIAELTFVLEDSKAGSPLAAYAGLASQFGIDLTGASSSGVFEGDNILEFLKSRLMIEKTLLFSVEINGRKKSLADLYIETYRLDEKWEKKPLLKGIHFPSDLARTKFTLQQDSILNVIQEGITKNNLQIEKPDKKLSFIAVKVYSADQVFSKAFTERLVKEATDFYVNTKIKRSRVNVDKLQAAADSLEILLNRKTYSLAATKDLNQNPARQVAGVVSELQSRDKLVLQTMYGEVIKNLEMSKMAMGHETPIVQIVDTPILPLKEEKMGIIKGIILGGFIATFLITVWLVLRRFYKEVMN